MSEPTLAIYLFGYNLNRIVYPWIAAIHSALDLAEQVYFGECNSQDNTYPSLMDTFAPEIADGHLVVSRHDWGTYHDVQAKICNSLLDQIGHRHNFALKMDADEVLHEDSFDFFREDMAYMRASGFVLGRPRYTHFSPDDKTTFPFIYATKATVLWTRANLRFNLGKGGDACALGGAPECQTNLQLYHYGKMHMGRREAALYKEQSFTKLYYDMGFPDKKVDAQQDRPEEFDYMKVFDVAAEAGQFQPFAGTHPRPVQGWLRTLNAREMGHAF